MRKYMKEYTFILAIFFLIIVGAGCASKEEGKIIVAETVNKDQLKPFMNEEKLVEAQVGPQIFCFQGKVPLSKNSNVTASSSDGRVKVIIEPTKLKTSNGDEHFRIWSHKETGIGDLKVSYYLVSPKGEYTSYPYCDYITTQEDKIVYEFGYEGETDVSIQAVYKDTQKKSNSSIPFDSAYDPTTSLPETTPTPVIPATPSP